MAERLESFDFARRGESQYPWQEWTDGAPWKVHRGDDYQGQTRNFAQRLYGEATRRGMKVKVHQGGDEIVFQFREMTEEERAEAEAKAKENHNAGKKG